MRKKENKGKRKKEKKETLVSGVELIMVPHVNIITKMPLKTGLWKLKTPKMCFQFL